MKQLSKIANAVVMKNGCILSFPCYAMQTKTRSVSSSCSGTLQNRPSWSFTYECAWKIQTTNIKFRLFLFHKYCLFFLLETMKLCIKIIFCTNIWEASRTGIMLRNTWQHLICNFLMNILCFFEIITLSFSMF